MQTRQPVGDGSRIVDALVTWPGGRLAVEVDGPHHFLSDPSTGELRRNGATVLRDAQLRRWGLDMMSVQVGATSEEALRSTEFCDALAGGLRQAGVPV